MTRRRKARPGFWAQRTVGEIMVISITFTVCFGILASGATVAAISLLRPETDVTVWVSRITGLMNTLVGLLAGFLAGRTDYHGHGTGTPPPEEEGP